MKKNQYIIVDNKKSSFEERIAKFTDDGWIIIPDSLRVSCSNDGVVLAVVLEKEIRD